MTSSIIDDPCCAKHAKSARLPIKRPITLTPLAAPSPENDGMNSVAEHSRFNIARDERMGFEQLSFELMLSPNGFEVKPNSIISSESSKGDGKMERYRRGRAYQFPSNSMAIKVLTIRSSTAINWKAPSRDNSCHSSIPFDANSQEVNVGNAMSYIRHIRDFPSSQFACDFRTLDSGLVPCSLTSDDHEVLLAGL